MKTIKNIGLVIFLIGLAIFTVLPVIGTYELTSDAFKEFVANQGIKSELFISEIESKVVGKSVDGMIAFSPQITETLESVNATHRKNKEYKKIIYTGPHDMAAELGKNLVPVLLCKTKGSCGF
jgi:hypothetical protein